MDNLLLEDNLFDSFNLLKKLRDKKMIELHEQFPVYDFIRNKGYGTKKHILALKENGASEIHRLSFKPIRKE